MSTPTPPNSPSHSTLTDEEKKERLRELNTSIESDRVQLMETKREMKVHIDKIEAYLARLLIKEIQKGSVEARAEIRDLMTVLHQFRKDILQFRKTLGQRNRVKRELQASIIGEEKKAIKIKREAEVAEAKASSEKPGEDDPVPPVIPGPSPLKRSTPMTPTTTVPVPSKRPRT